MTLHNSPSEINACCPNGITRSHRRCEVVFGRLLRVRDIGYFASSSTDTALTMANSGDGSKLRTILSNTFGLMPRKLLVRALTAPPAYREMSKSRSCGSWFPYTLTIRGGAPGDAL